MNFKISILFLVIIMLISCSNDHRSTDNFFDSDIEYETIFTEQQILFDNINGQTFPVDTGSKAAYLWVDADDQYLYALYMDQIRTEMEQLSASKIHILDWDLNLVRAVELDHQTTYLAADRNGGIYTFKYVDEGTEFRYQRLFDE
jgi:hypothetical protein